MPSHHEPVNPPDPVELRTGSEDSPPGWVEGWRGDRRIAAFVEHTASSTSFELVGRASPIDAGDVGALLDALTARSGPPVGTGVALVTNDPLFRDLARRHGFTGPLRGALVPGADGPSGWTDDPDGVRDAVQQLLPGISVGVEAEAGAARALLRRAVSGVANTFNLFAAPDDHGSPTRFSVPRRDDLLVESVARCIDTTIEIRRRFGRVASSARRVSFDHADFQLLHGHHAGSGGPQQRFDPHERELCVGRGTHDDGDVPGAAVGWRVVVVVSWWWSAGVPAPFNQIDGTTAHEMWHQMEGAFEAWRSMDGINLRRGLGEALGVETLEQAVNGVRTASPDSWKLAHVRLVNEVSAYGATAPIEATAEMFKLWWCANGEPAPIVRRFGELIEPLLADFKD